MAEQTPKLIFFTRRQYARLTAAKLAMDDILTLSVVGGGGSALTTMVTNGKVQLLLPLIAGLLGFTARMIRNQISLYMTIGQIQDPILLNQTTIVSQPDPITPKEDVQPSVGPPITPA